MHSSGNMYVVDAWNNRIQKFVPDTGVEPIECLGEGFRVVFTLLEDPVRDKIKVTIGEGAVTLHRPVSTA